MGIFESRTRLKPGAKNRRFTFFNETIKHNNRFKSSITIILKITAMSITSHNAYDCRNNKENAPPSHNKRMVGFALNGDENDDDDNAGGVVHRRTPHPAKKQKELALSSDFKSKHSSKSIFSPEVLNTGTDMTAEMYNHDDELFKVRCGS